MLITVLVFSLTGCMMKQHEQAVTKTITKVEKIYTQRVPPRPVSTVNTSNRVVLADKAFVITPKQRLPAVFNQKTFYMANAGEDLESVLEGLSETTKMPIKLTQDAKAKLAKAKAATTRTSSAISYKGTFSEVLNAVANNYGLQWKYADNLVQFYNLETVVYALDAPVGNFTFKNSISSAATGKGSESLSSSSDMNMNFAIDAGVSPWQAALNTIKNILSEEGKLDSNPAEGYITVTDNPLIQKKVADYIAKINDKINKKIAVQVDVYDVENSASAKYGFDIERFQRAIKGVPISFTSGAGTALGVIGGQRISSTSPNTSVILQALSTLGKTTRVTGSTVYTISGQPAPIQSSTVQGYVKSIKMQTVPGPTGNQTTYGIEPGTVTTGYNLTVTPRLQSNNQILVNLNLQISTLLSLKEISAVGSGGKKGETVGSSERIQIPEVQSKSFMENMVLHSGQSLLIAGFQESGGTAKTSSIGPEQLWALGGAKGTSQNKVTTVVVITPYIISGAR